MAENLPVENDGWWDTLVTHAEWVWFVILAIIIDLVADI